MAFDRVYFRAHEGYWVIEAIKKKMQVPAQERRSNVVIPFPNYVTGSCFNSLRANVARNAEFRQMSIGNSSFRKKAREIVLAQFWAVHTYRITADVQKR